MRNRSQSSSQLSHVTKLRFPRRLTCESIPFSKFLVSNEHVKCNSGDIDFGCIYYVIVMCFSGGRRNNSKNANIPLYACNLCGSRKDRATYLGKCRTQWQNIRRNKAAG